MKRILSILLTLIVIIAVILATIYLSSQCMIPGVCNNKTTINATTILNKIQTLSSLTTTRSSATLCDKRSRLSLQPLRSTRRDRSRN